jgi:hypothetical protein
MRCRDEKQTAPNFEQHTLSGHFSAFDHWAPHPGSQSDFASHEDVQFPAPQKVGPRPQTPLLPQQPIEHGLVGLQLKSWATESEKKSVSPARNKVGEDLMVQAPRSKE